MPSVLLGGLCASDPAGSRAVRDAVSEALPNHHVRDMAAYPDAAARLAAARRTEAVVMTGAAFGPTGFATAVLAGLARRPLLFVGALAGLAAGRLGAAAARGMAGRARLLLLADDASAARLAAAGVPTPLRVAADPAWVAVDLHPRRHPRGESVAVALDGRVPTPVEQALRAALVTVARTGRRVRLVPWDGPGGADLALAGRLERAVENAVPGATMIEAAPETLAEAACLFAEAHAVVALRHRAVHAAAAAGVPVVAVPTDPGCGALATRLGQAVLGPLELTSALPVALERIGAAAAPSAVAVRDEKTRARSGLRLMRLVIEPEAVAASEVDDLPLVPVPWLS